MCIAGCSQTERSAAIPQTVTANHHCSAKCTRKTSAAACYDTRWCPATSATLRNRLSLRRTRSRLCRRRVRWLDALHRLLGAQKTLQGSLGSVLGLTCQPMRTVSVSQCGAHFRIGQPGRRLRQRPGRIREGMASSTTGTRRALAAVAIGRVRNLDQVERASRHRGILRGRPSDLVCAPGQCHLGNPPTGHTRH